MRLSNFILLLLILSSCQKPNASHVLDEKNLEEKIIIPNKTEFNVYEWEHRGHTYIVIDRAHGSGITHAGHCRCYQR